MGFVFVRMIVQFVCGREPDHMAGDFGGTTGEIAAPSIDDLRREDTLPAGTEVRSRFEMRRIASGT
jgi:hypothetical protein